MVSITVKSFKKCLFNHMCTFSLADETFLETEICQAYFLLLLLPSF
jgi:hypothetical protein